MEQHTGKRIEKEIASWRMSTLALSLSICLPLSAAAGQSASQSQSGDAGRPPSVGELSLEELLNTRVTTATRTSERVRDVPARIEVITADQIRNRGYRSLTDVLRDLPDFKIELGADQDMPADVVVQGTRGTSRIVVLLDGIRISSPTAEPLPIVANYPVHSARQIEVVYGPGSALYGADAFSAVVNIITRSADQAEGLVVSTSAGQFGLSNTTGSYGVRLGRGANLIVAGQIVSDRQAELPKYYPGDFGTLDAQRSGVFNTVFGPLQPAVPASATYSNPMSAHSLQAVLGVGGLTLSVFESTSQMPTAPAYTPDNAIYSDEAFIRNHLLVTSGTYTRQIGRVASTSTLMVSRHELDPESGYRNVYSNMDRSYKYAHGSMLKAEQQISWRASRLTFTAGGTAERFFSIPQGADLNAPVTSQDVPGTILGTDITDDFFKIRYANVGGYLQAQYAASENLMLIVGARGDRNTRYGGTFNPRVGLVWQPGSRSGVKALYGTAFLAPSPYQAYSHYGSFYSTDGGETYASSFWHLPNPDLQPQRKDTIELSARREIASGIDVWGSGFYSWLNDLIRESDSTERYAGVYHGWPVDFIQSSVNGGQQRTYGASVGVDALRSFMPGRQITGRASVSLADGHVIGNAGEQPLEVGGMAPMILHLGADLTLDRWSVAPRLLVIGRQRLLATSIAPDGRERRRTLDGYAVLDVNIRRESVFKNVSVFATLENVLDRRYRNINLRAHTNPEELVGAPQGPRRITVGIEVRMP